MGFTWWFWLTRELLLVAIDLWGNHWWCMIYWGNDSLRSLCWWFWLTRKPFGSSRLIGETYEEVLDDSDFLGKILLLITHEGVVLVFWTHEGVLEDSNPLGENFSIYDSLGSCLMVLAHKGISLVTSNPLGSVFKPTDPIGNVFIILHVFQPVEVYFHHLGTTFITSDVSWSTKDVFDFFLTFPTFWESNGDILNFFIPNYM